MKRATTIVCALSLVLICSAARAQEPSVLIQEAKVAEQPIEDILTVYGQVEADPDSVQAISVLHDALVTRVAVSPGQRVTRGQLLLELATSPVAHMEYLKARGAVDYAQSELARQQRLMQERLTTNTQVDAARNALRDAQASLQSLEAQGQNSAMNKVTALTAGIITGIGAKQGDRLQAGTPVVEIAVGNRLVARVGVEPEDIRAIKPGAPVKLRSVFGREDVIDSQMGDIHAIINPATRLVDALVPIPADQTDGLVIGGSLSAAIQIAARTGLTVPRSAVLEDQQGAYVFRVENGKAARVAVTTGWKSDQCIEITSGLKAGESVVSVGNYELSDGIAVREGK